MRHQVVRISSPPPDVPIKVTWVNQNPQLNSIFFINKTTGWAAGGRTLLATSDGGATWAAQDLGVSDPMLIQFLDQNVGWIPIDWGMVLLMTRNGGKTWASVPKPDGVNFYQTHFVDANTGWAASNDAMYKTTDGGQTWQTATGAAVKRPFYFVDASHGWAATEKGDITASTDGGNSWQIQKTNQELPILAIFFLDRNRGWAARFDGVMTTTDGGQHWQLPKKTIDGYFERLQFVDAKVGWSFGKNRLLHTTDGGLTWDIYSGSDHPGAPTCTGILFLDSDTGWCTTEVGTIVATKDGGGTWQTQNSVPPSNPGKAIRAKDYQGKPAIPQAEYGSGYEFKKILFANKSTGWALGTLSGGAEADTQGVIASTQDGGRSWTTQLIDDEPYDMYFSHNGTGSIYTKGYFEPTEGVFHPLISGLGPWLNEFEFRDGVLITLKWRVALRGNLRVTVKNVEFSPGTDSNFGPLPLKGLKRKSGGRSCLQFRPAKLGIQPGTKLRFRIRLQDPDGTTYTHEIARAFIHRGQRVHQGDDCG